MSEELMVSVDDGIMTMTMNRPQAKNAMNKSMSHAIAEAVDRFEADAEIRVAILTGAGGTFCSGMDLKGFLAGETPVVKGRGFGGLTQYSPTKPLIAAAEGFALAGGFPVTWWWRPQPPNLVFQRLNALWLPVPAACSACHNKFLRALPWNSRSQAIIMMPSVCMRLA